MALIVLLLFFLDFEILQQFGLTDKKLVVRYLFIICLTAPLTPLVALIFRIGRAVISSMPGLSAAPTPALPNLIVPISPWTYARLDYKHFFWSIFYFGIYFYISLQIYQFLGFYVVEYGSELADVMVRKADKCLSHADELDRLSNHTLTDDQKVKYLEKCRSSTAYYSQTSNFMPTASLFAGIGGVLIFLDTPF